MLWWCLILLLVSGVLTDAPAATTVAEQGSSADVEENVRSRLESIRGDTARRSPTSRSCLAPLLIQGKAKDIPAAVRHYRQFQSCIIVATEAVNVSALAPAAPHVVLVPEVKFQDKARVNKQVLSTLFGLERAAALKAHFVFKVRADLLISRFDVLMKKLVAEAVPAFLAIWRFNHNRVSCVRDVPVDYFQFGPLSVMQLWWRSIGLDTYPVDLDHFGEYVLTAALQRVYRGAVFFTHPFMAANNIAAYSTKYEFDYVERVSTTQCHNQTEQRRCYCLPVSAEVPDCCDGLRMPCRKKSPTTNCRLLNYRT